MANVRFIWTNLADSALSITATSTAGSLATSNLQLDERAAVWRSSTPGSPTTVAQQTLDVRWALAQSIDSICGAWSNFSSAATIRCLGYTNVGDMVAVFDQTVSPDTALALGNTTFQNWIAAAASIKQLKIIITDAANSDGYVQLSRLVIGKRVTPVVNADTSGFMVGFIEQGKPSRAESRDLRMEPLGRYRRMSLPLAILEPASRDLIVALVANGLGRGVWVSALPDSSDASTQQLHAFWGALVSDTDFKYTFYNNWSATLAFEEMG